MQQNPQAKLPLSDCLYINPIARESFPNDPPLPDIQDTERLASRFARASSVPIMVIGEPGTGKTAFSHSMQRQSPRANAPYVVFDTPPNLEHADFVALMTGRQNGTTQGLFEFCDSGTLLIRNVERLPPQSQRLLFHIIKERQFPTFDGKTSSCIISDVRIHATTAENLARRVEQRTFDHGLFMIFRPAALMLPPLSDRPRDIPTLAKYFLDKAVQRNGLSKKTLSPDAIAALTHTRFPANLRDLRDIMTSAALQSDDDIIKASAVGLPPMQFPTSITYLFPPIQTKDGFQTIPEVWNVHEEVRRHMIARALIANNFHTRNAARSLGMKTDGALAGQVRALFGAADFKRTTIEPLIRGWVFQANHPYQDVIQAWCESCSTLDALESHASREYKVLIKFHLSECSFIKDRASKTLGVSVKTIDEYLSKYNLEDWATIEHRNFFLGLMESNNYNPTHVAARLQTDVRYVTVRAKEFGIVPPSIAPDAARPQP